MASIDLSRFDYGGLIFKASYDDSLQKRAADNHFWREWLNKKYNLDFEPSDKDFRKIAEKVAVIIFYLKENNIAVTLASVKYLVGFNISSIEKVLKEKNCFMSFFDIRKVPREYDISFEGLDSADNFLSQTQ